MRSRNVCGFSRASLLGLAIGVTAGLAAGFLAAPMRGSAMRATLRDRGLALVDEGRRALRTNIRRAEPEPLRATLGEIASMHDGSQLLSLGMTS